MNDRPAHKTRRGRAAAAAARRRRQRRIRWTLLVLAGLAAIALVVGTLADGSPEDTPQTDSTPAPEATSSTEATP